MGCGMGRRYAPREESANGADASVAELLRGGRPRVCPRFERSSGRRRTRMAWYSSSEIAVYGACAYVPPESRAR